MTTPQEQVSIDQRLDGITEQLAQITAELRQQQQHRERWGELLDEVAPLEVPAVASVNARLQQLVDRGYFSFARQAAGVVDTVVTSFSDEDVRLLGDNIVLILQTIKQMTQPEVMTLLGRTGRAIQDAETETVTEVPSTLSLIRQMRDPQVRRALGRVLATLRTLGADESAHRNGAAAHTTAPTEVSST